MLFRSHAWQLLRRAPHSGVPLFFMPTAAPSRRDLLVLLAVFVASGCAALIYEVVWFQMLELALGSSAISLGILLGVFMGGMCAGSLLAPRVLAHPRMAALHPLRAYALIEMAIGALGLAMLALIPLAGSVYISLAHADSRDRKSTRLNSSHT